MFTISWLTFRHAFKDRIGIIILSMVFLYFLVPIFSSFSMRQPQEVSITMSLFLNSFILLILSIFGSTATIWKDIERKYVCTILSYPINRTEYLIGRFIGFAFVMLVVMIVNYILSVVSIYVCESMYKSQLPVIWRNITWAFVFDYLEFVLLMSFGFLFASFSTSFFIPFFATIAVFVAGNASEGIYHYIFHTSNYSLSFKLFIKAIYYILPNFSSFDFTVYAAYALRINSADIVYTLIYFVVYFSITMSLANIIFSKRDLP